MADNKSKPIINHYIHPMRAVIQESTSGFGRSSHVPDECDGDAAIDMIHTLASDLGLEIKEDPLLEGDDSFNYLLFKPSAKRKVEEAIRDLDAVEEDDEDEFIDIYYNKMCGSGNDVLIVGWDWKWFDKTDSEHLVKYLKKLGFKAEKVKDGWEISK